MSNRPNQRPAAGGAPGAASGGGNRATVWAIVIGVVVLLGVAAIAITALSGGDDSTADPGTTTEQGDKPDPRELDAVAVSGNALPAYSDSPDDPAVGQQVPVLTGVDEYGEPMTIGEPGEPTVVVFLAHWCPHCQAEVPRLAEWLEQNGQPEGVRVVGVSTAFDKTRGNWPPGAWLDDEGWTQDTMVDPSGSAGETWGLASFPYFVVVGADGTVVKRASGELSTEEFAALVEAAKATGAATETTGTSTTVVP